MPIRIPFLASRHGQASDQKSAEARTSQSPGAGNETWDWPRVIRWLVVWKISFFLVAFACLEFWPDWELGKYEELRHWPLPGEANLQSRFATWDAAEFLSLAEQGYRKGDASCALFPLFPTLVRGASYVFGENLFISAIVLAQLFSMAAVLAFHRLTWEMFGPRAADWSSIFLIAFPGAIFLHFPYAEGLFVGLASVFLLSIHRGGTWCAAVTGFFLALTNPFGLSCLATLVWYLWRENRPMRDTLSLYGPIAGIFVCHLAWNSATGFSAAGWEVRLPHSDHSIAQNVSNWKALAQASIDIGSFHGAKDSALDRAFFLVFAGSLPFLWRLHKGLFSFAFLAGIAPVLGYGFNGYARHALLCLPLFMLLGRAFQNSRWPWLLWPLLGGCAALQLFLLARHLNFRYAG